MSPIEVYADVWCPFAHVGLRWLARTRSALGREDVGIIVRAWPLELVNGAPLAGETTLEHIRDLQRQAAPDLFQHFAPLQFPTSTIEALTLAATAYRCGTRTGELVSWELRDLLFEKGVDCSRPEVLGAIAAEHGITPAAEDRATVLHDWQEGRSRGVKGSPHFFCGDLDAFCPSLDISRSEAGTVHVHENMARLQTFVNECISREPLA